MVVDEFLVYGFTASSAGCVAALVYPVVSRGWARSAGAVERYQEAKIEKVTKTLDELFIEVKPRWLLRMAYGLGPPAAGLLCFLLFRHVALGLIGVAAGIAIPGLWVRQARALRTRKFKAQFVDALLIFSSSLRAGLSLTQAFEQVESEMGPPVSQEFGLMLKTYRLGLTFEEALHRLNERVPCEELELVTTAVQVARETGGDITHLITELITTIRERKKLWDKVKTLTLQGRLQAYIMSALPLLFAGFVRTFNPSYFDVMLHEPAGQMALMVAVGLWCVGVVLLMKLSRVDI